MNTASYFLAIIPLVMSILLILRNKAPLGFMALFPKLAAGALSPVWFLLGLTGATLGGLSGNYWTLFIGGISALFMAWYIWKAVSIHADFESAFGPDWRNKLTGSGSSRLLKQRWIPYLKDPKSPEPNWERDISFWTIPGTSRQLLCDVWQPADGEPRSGLAMIFFHGSAWTVFDKDFGTRIFFRQLVAQGHVIMDVAYRLCPEVDIYPMVGDVKRAVAWMKANAGRYKVNPERIVLGGASAGGHLSMLAAFALAHPQLTPEDVRDLDLSVRGVVSLYGPSDLRAVYAHTSQQRLVNLPKVPIGDPNVLGKAKMSNSGRLDMLLGGHPAEVPQAYDLASPVTHVHPGCPPTLLIQGEHDMITPVDATRIIFRKLVEASVPAVNVVFPDTDHAFDLVLPRLSPPSQSALYEVERFLACLQ